MSGSPYGSSRWSNMKESQGSLMFGFWSSFQKILGAPCVLFLKKFERIWRTTYLSLVFEVVWRNPEDPFFQSFWSNLKKFPGPLTFDFGTSLKESWELSVGLIIEVIWKNLRDQLCFVFEVVLKKSWDHCVLFLKKFEKFWGPIVSSFWSGLKESRDPFFRVFEVVWKNVKVLWSMMSCLWSNLKEFRRPLAYYFWSS